MVPEIWLLPNQLRLIVEIPVFYRGLGYIPGGRWLALGFLNLKKTTPFL